MNASVNSSSPIVAIPAAYIGSKPNDNIGTKRPLKLNANKMSVAARII